MTVPQPAAAPELAPEVVEALRAKLTEAREFHTAQLDEASGDEVSFALSRRSERILEQIDAALEAMAEGTYGTCGTCGGEIGVERLEAIPYTPLCARCASVERR